MNISDVDTEARKVNKIANFYLSWFLADGDDLIGSELLNIDEDTIRKLFYLSLDDFELDGLVVTASQRKHLQKLVEHQIDLNQFDYFVEYMFVYDNTI